MTLLVQCLSSYRLCVCARLTLCLFVGLSVSVPESAHVGLGELLSSGTFSHERTGVPAHRAAERR